MNGFVQRVRRLLSVVRWQLFGLISYFGWANARVESRNLAGHVGSAAPGRERTPRRSALAHPTFPKTDRFVDDDGRAPLGEKHDLAGLYGYKVLFQQKGDRAEHSYRAVVEFGGADGREQLVAARHLLQCVDVDLLDGACARRLHCCGIDRPTHNDAVARVRAFRLRHDSCVVHVARLDVKALHDTISHAVVRTALVDAAARAVERNVVIAPNVLRVVDKLLASFSFGPDVVVGARKILEERDPDGRVAWPADELKAFHRDPLTARMGLPQGSPVSDVLANLVLDGVDRPVLGDHADPDLLYLRHLDDIFIASTDESECQAALARVTAALHKLGLVPHPPKECGLSDAGYWSAKSVAPLPWAPRGTGREWVGYLGYEIKFDGEVRIRKDTIRRHKDRLRQTVASHEVEFDDQFAASGSDAVSWFVTHAAGSVAGLERALVRACVRPAARCWVNCFPLAGLGGEALAEQARDLDRFRRVLLSRYRRHVEEQGRQLGVPLGKVRSLRDHYRLSYHFNLLARFARRASVGSVPGALGQT